MTPKLISARQLAAKVGWPVSRIKKLKATNAIPYVEIGECFYYPENAVAEFLEKNMVPANRQESSEVGK